MTTNFRLCAVELSEHDIKDMWEFLMDDRYYFECNICDYLEQQIEDNNISNDKAVESLYNKLKEYYETSKK